jgi:hypothetical protein
MNSKMMQEHWGNELSVNDRRKVIMKTNFYKREFEKRYLSDASNVLNFARNFILSSLPRELHVELIAVFCAESSK